MPEDTDSLVKRVRRGVAEPHRANNRYEYRDALAALTELAERTRLYEKHEREQRHRAEAAEAQRDELTENLRLSREAHWADRAALVAQRDELVEALERIAHDGPNPGSLRSPELQWASDIARAALAKVRDA